MYTRFEGFGNYNKMFYFPMAFMLVATLTSVITTILRKLEKIGTPEMVWGEWFQLVFAVAMSVLAVILVIEGFQTFKKQKAKK